MLSLFFLLVLSEAKVYVLSPPGLKAEMQSRNPGVGEVRASLGNFGNPPYGTAIVGRVFFAKRHEMVCEPPEIDFASDPDTVSVPILLAKRGDCTFAVKARQAENSGFKALLVLDNIDELTENVVMADSGYGGNIQIPSFLISKSDGEEMLRYIELLYEEVVVKLVFEVKKRDFVIVNLWFSSNEQQAGTFLAELSVYLHKFEKAKVEIEPHYALWNCKECADVGYLQEHSDCISGGRYCAPDPDGVGPAKGRDVLYEDLRQLCVFNVTYTDPTYARWLDYLRYFNSSCLSHSDLTEKCSISAMRSASVDAKQVLDCVENSFKGDNPAINDNWRMQWEKTVWTSSSPGFYPALIINSEMYRGDWEGQNVAKAICASFYDPPDYCSEIDFIVIDPPGVSPGLIVVLLAVLFAVIVGVLVGCRLYLKRELTGTMNQQVSLAVSQYRALGGEAEMGQRARGDR